MHPFNAEHISNSPQHPGIMFDLFVEFADTLSNDAYVQFCNGDMIDTEMQHYFEKIGTWSHLTIELSKAYEKHYAHL